VIYTVVTIQCLLQCFNLFSRCRYGLDGAKDQESELVKEPLVEEATTEQEVPAAADDAPVLVTCLYYCGSYSFGNNIWKLRWC
jgi:hypothetical protein